MKIFITGGTGFIGRRVIKELRRRRHRVVLLKSKLENSAKVKKEIERCGPDVVIHLAWEGLPDISPALCRKNARMGVAFMKLLGSLRITKVIAAGSAWEYENPRGPHRAVIAAKRVVRKAGERYIGKTGIFVWAVPFFVYGAGKPGRSLLPSLIAQAQKGEAPTPNNPNAWHDFIYADDVARAIVLLVERKIAGGTYDIGSGKLTRTGEIANTVAKIFTLPQKRLPRIKKTGLRADPRPLAKLGWRPRVSLAQGIKTML